ncbi:MAG: MFS transporter, partial [Planctomycetota bacterium]
GWIKALMTPAVEGAFGIDGGWVLVYTAGLMMVLRFLIAPIVAVLAPLGVLLMSSLCAAAGIYGLSLSSGVALIIAAATVYGVGQAFFWPTTLGVVAERFPRGGALTLNGIAAVGMLGVGIIGGPALGNLQDQQIDRQLSADAALYAAVMEAEPETSVFGTYRKLSAEALEGLGEAERAAVEVEVDAAKAGALRWAAVPPLGLAVGYAALMLYYRVRGGYRPVELEEAPPETPEPAGHRPGVK